MSKLLVAPPPAAPGIRARYSQRAQIDSRPPGAPGFWSRESPPPQRPRRRARRRRAARARWSRRFQGELHQAAQLAGQQDAHRRRRRPPPPPQARTLVADLGAPGRDDHADARKMLKQARMALEADMVGTLTLASAGASVAEPARP